MRGCACLSPLMDFQSCQFLLILHFLTAYLTAWFEMPRARCSPTNGISGRVLPVCQPSHCLLSPPPPIQAAISVCTMFYSVSIIRDCRHSQTNFELIWKESSALTVAWLSSRILIFHFFQFLLIFFIICAFMLYTYAGTMWYATQGWKLVSSLCINSIPLLQYLLMSWTLLYRHLQI